MADVSTLYIRVDSNGVVTASGNFKEFKKRIKGVTEEEEKLHKQNEKLNESTNKSSAYLNRYSSGLKTVGRDIQRYGLALAGASAAITKFSFDLTSGLGQVQTLIPETGDRIYDLQETVKELSVETGTSLSDLTEGLYQTISAFQDTADTEEIFTQASKAAIAGASSVADSIALASAVTKAYGDTSAEATSKVFDLAFETVRLGQTTFPELANGIQTATDSAVRLGVSQEELFATFSSLTGVIGDAAEVATKFRSASASLLNPNEKLLDLFSRVEEATGEQIVTGADFVKAAGGMASALKLIVDTAADSDEPLQDYIRRIEGITLSSRLSTTSIEKYLSDLQAMYRAVGASDKAYQEVKEGIDEFHQSILESRQQIIVAATEIGANLIPRLSELVKGVADVVTWISQLDDGIQGMIISIGGFVIALGPALIALGGLLRALQLISALKTASTIASITSAIGPAGLVIAILAAVSALGIFIYKQNQYIKALKEQKKALAEAIGEQNDFMSSLDAVAKAQLGVNEENEISSELVTELTNKYPDLVKEVGIYEVALAKAKAELIAIRNLENLEKTPDLFGLEIEQIDKIQKQIRQLGASVAYAKEHYMGPSIQEIMFSSRGNITQQEAEQQFAEGLNVYKSAFVSQMEKLREDQLEIIQEINSKSGDLGILASFDEVEGRVMFEALRPELEDFVERLNGYNPDLEGGKLKTWQEWFEEIAGVAKDSFGNSGSQAGLEFFKRLRENANKEINFAGLFGENVDFSKIFEDQLEEARNIFRELSQIPSEEIKNGEIFKTPGINAEEFDNIMRSLSNTIDDLQNRLEGGIFRDLDSDIARLDGLKESLPELYTETDIAEEKLKSMEKALADLAGNNFDTASKKAQELKQNIIDLRKEIAGMGSDLSEKVAVQLLDFFGALDYSTKSATERSEKMISVLSDLGDSLASLATNAISDSFYELGVALGDSSKGLEDFGDAMAGVLKSVLDALPALFIQAGLQLIGTNLPLGLSLIAAGLAGNVVAGLVQGTIDEKQENNAHGAIYSYAKGAALGSFENSIVNTPTLFNNGAGLMGEAGAEAIMPLTRTSSGDLGVVAVGGGGANVNINIINNSGENVTKTEKTNADGSKDVEIMIGKMVNKVLTDGTADKAMRASYGINRKGR